MIFIASATYLKDLIARREPKSLDMHQELFNEKLPQQAQSKESKYQSLLLDSSNEPEAGTMPLAT